MINWEQEDQLGSYCCDIGGEDNGLGCRKAVEHLCVLEVSLDKKSNISGQCRAGKDVYE